MFAQDGFRYMYFYMTTFYRYSQTLSLTSCLQNDVTVVNQWVVNGTHYARTLEAWLQRTDGNKERVMHILRQSYGGDAEQQLFNWRLFFMFCSEVFGYKGGNEWFLTHVLMKKKLQSSL